MNNQLDKLTRSLVQSVRRRTALKKFGAGLAGMALACFGLADEAAAAIKYSTNDYPMKRWVASPATLREVASGSTNSVDALKEVALTRPASEVLDFAYYDFEVWVEVLKGELTFDALSDEKGKGLQLRTKDILWIPRGEVHRVLVGANGAEYRLYAVERPKAKALSPDEIEMLQMNLKFPVQEENADGHAHEFFAAHLSESLDFCRVDGSVVGKDAFLAGFVKKNRVSSGTICVLNRSGTSILLSTVVTIRPDGAAPASFANIRLFAKESGTWRCRMWINYPEVQRPA